MNHGITFAEILEWFASVDEKVLLWCAIGALLIFIACLMVCLASLDRDHEELEAVVERLVDESRGWGSSSASHGEGEKK